MGRRAVVDLALVREREGSRPERRTGVMCDAKFIIGLIDVGKIIWNRFRRYLGFPTYSHASSGVTCSEIGIRAWIR